METHSHRRASARPSSGIATSPEQPAGDRGRRQRPLIVEDGTDGPIRGLWFAGIVWLIGLFAAAAAFIPWGQA